MLEGLVAREKDLHDLETVSLHLEGSAPHVDPAMAGHIRHNALFIAKNIRQAVQEGRTDFTPVFLSDIPTLFANGVLPLDLALIHVSPPDAHDFCSLGISVDVAQPAAVAAHYVIAEINQKMPRSLGQSFIHRRDIDAYIETDLPVIEAAGAPITEVHQRIATQVITMIGDDATLQLSIGAIADAVLQQFFDHKDLGIHTEMFSEGVIDLVQAGVITGIHKRLHPELIVASFVMGTRRLYDFINNKPMVALFPSHYTNDPRVIAEHEELVAINSAIEVDLTGQVCADSIGPRFYKRHRRADRFHPRRGTGLARAAHHRSPGHGPGRQQVPHRRSAPAPASSPRVAMATSSSPSTASPPCTGGRCGIAHKP